MLNYGEIHQKSLSWPLTELVSKGFKATGVGTEIEQRQLEQSRPDAEEAKQLLAQAPEKWQTEPEQQEKEKESNKQIVDRQIDENL